MNNTLNDFKKYLYNKTTPKKENSYDSWMGFENLFGKISMSNEEIIKLFDDANILLRDINFYKRNYPEDFKKKFEEIKKIRNVRSIFDIAFLEKIIDPIKKTEEYRKYIATNKVEDIEKDSNFKSLFAHYNHFKKHAEKIKNTLLYDTENMEEISGQTKQEVEENLRKPDPERPTFPGSGYSINSEGDIIPEGGYKYRREI